MNLLRKTEDKAVAHKSTCETLCAVTLLLQGKGCHIPATGCQSHFLWSWACRHVDVSTRMNEFKYNRLNVMKICIVHWSTVCGRYRQIPFTSNRMGFGPGRCP